MSCMSDMTPTPTCSGCSAKIIKVDLVLSKEEKICYKMVYYTFYLG